MPGHLNWVSLLISTDQQPRRPDPLVLRRPGVHEPALSRVIFHETVHYWQQIASGFLIQLAAEELQRLLDYENHGEARPPGPLRREYVAVKGENSFSARDLTEALARCWDVHVIDPTRLIELELKGRKRVFTKEFIDEYAGLKSAGRLKREPDGVYSGEAFDLAMRGAGGSYARPYISVLDRFGSFTAAALFPIIGHFALQTTSPVSFFSRFLTRATGRLRLPRKPPSMNDVWKDLYLEVRDDCNSVLREETGEGFVPGPRFMTEDPLRVHPVYRWVYRSLDRSVREKSVPADDIRDRLATEIDLKSQPDGSLVPYMLALDRALCLPGDPEARGILIERLAPPSVRFADGSIWALAELHRRETIRSQRGPQPTQEQIVAAQCVEIDDRWSRFVKAARGY